MKSSVAILLSVLMTPVWSEPTLPSETTTKTTTSPKVTEVLMSPTLSGLANLPMMVYGGLTPATARVIDLEADITANIVPYGAKAGIAIGPIYTPFYSPGFQQGYYNGYSGYSVPLYRPFVYNHPSNLYSNRNPPLKQAFFSY